MTISAPLRSNARRHKATTQWDTRTVALCRIAAAGTAAVAEEEGLNSDVEAEPAMVAQVLGLRLGDLRDDLAGNAICQEGNQ